MAEADIAPTAIGRQRRPAAARAAGWSGSIVRRASAGTWSVLGAAVLWGTTGTAATFAPGGSSSLAIGAAAMGIGGIALFLGARPPSLPAMGSDRYVLFGHGLRTTTARDATLLSLLEPAVAAVLADLIAHQHLSKLGWLGIGLVLASVLLQTRPTAVTRSPADDRILFDIRSRAVYEVAQQGSAPPVSGASCTRCQRDRFTSRTRSLTSWSR